MIETQVALYVHPEFGRLQLHFQNEALVQVDLLLAPGRLFIQHGP